MVNSLMLNIDDMKFFEPLLRSNYVFDENMNSVKYVVNNNIDFRDNFDCEISTDKPKKDKACDKN